MRVPVTTTLSIEEFSGASVITASSMVKNGVFDKYPNGNWYVTQRPAVNIIKDASDDVSDAKGRGIYYWEAVDATYFVNDGTVYKDAYSAPLAVTMSSGTQRVYFFVVGDYLVILDPENDEGWYINSSSSTTLTQITDTDFTGLTLRKGGAVLNGRLYVLDKSGAIYNSALEDPTTWATNDFITAELEQDDGVILAQNGTELAVFGNRTTEYFYDAQNPTNSPLAARTDISHEMGAVDEHSMWSESQTMFYASLSPSGQVAVFAMSGMQINKVSTNGIDSFLTSAVMQNSVKLMGSGFSTGGRVFYVLTLYYDQTTVTPKTTLVYEASSGTWSMWELMHTGIDDFPLVDWTRSTKTKQGQGILSNGDVVTIFDDFDPQDLTLAFGYVVSGYVQTGYVSTSGQTGVNIEMQIISGQFDGGTRNSKRMHSLRYIGTATQGIQNLTVQWTDEVNNNYNTGKTLDLSKPGQRITRLGPFRQRNFKISYSGNEKIELEGLEVEIDAATS